MLRLEPRKEPARSMLYLTPFLALLLTVIGGLALFAAIGKNPFQAMQLIFLSPFTSVRSLSEILVKATPLILIAIGLSVGFRAGIWNIGAEGQFTLGAISGSTVALAIYPGGGVWLLPAMCIAAVLGGMAWAAIPALLKTHFNANEILTSLMLVYVAGLVLSILMYGALKDPEGFNFPQSRQFQPPAQLPLLFSQELIPGSRAHVGFLVALALVAVAAVIASRHMLGLKTRVLGEAPRAARFAGFSEKGLTWTCFMISGGLAGLAGLFEAAGPVGQLTPKLPVGYGFTAIIVAFLGRLNPIGILAAGLLLALTYIGGERAQIAMSLPSATTSVVQGMLLFFLLATDVLINYRVRWRRPRPVEAAKA